jgi:HPr kinase/phosphorylase
METSRPEVNKPVRARAVFRALQAALELRWLGGEAGAERVIWTTDNTTDTPVGRLNWVHPPRIQILDQDELHFLDTLEAAARSPLIECLLGHQAGAVLVCGDLNRASLLAESADTAGTPLWHTPAAPDTVLERFMEYQHSLGGSTLVHGELLEVFGLGVLITGASGIGKSELALELVSRGHRLIADDTPELIRVAPNVLEGSCPPALRGFLEVRGLGILNLSRMFGDSAIKRNKRVRLIINLVRLEDAVIPAELRLNGSRIQRRILDVKIPALNLPIAPGRNLAVLVECAVRDHIQRLSGYYADQDLTARLQHEMAGEPVCE